MQTDRQQTSGKLSRILWVGVAIAVLYSGFVMLTRWRETRAAEAELQRREAAADREVVERYGSGQLKVLMFYANPPVVRPGGRTMLCYGVANAKSVGIEPDVEAIQPSLSRCVEVQPKQTTEYTFTAEAEDGSPVRQAVTVRVE